MTRQCRRRGAELDSALVERLVTAGRAAGFWRAKRPQPNLSSPASRDCESTREDRRSDAGETSRDEKVYRMLSEMEREDEAESGA